MKFVKFWVDILFRKFEGYLKKQGSAALGPIALSVFIVAAFLFAFVKFLQHHIVVIFVAVGVVFLVGVIWKIFSAKDLSSLFSETQPSKSVKPFKNDYQQKKDYE